MTSSNAPRQTGAMAAASRGSRFPGMTMGNGVEKSSQPLGTNFSAPSPWAQSNIWGSNWKNTRETSEPEDPNDIFPKAPSGSSALAASSEAEPSWVSRSGWNNAEPSQPRNVSGNTSPSRSRIDAPVHDLNSTSGYYSTAQPAIGQRAPIRSKAGLSSDTVTVPFGISQFPGDYMGDTEDDGGYGALKFTPEAAAGDGYHLSKRPSQDVTYQSLSGIAPRDPGMPTTSHSETDAIHGHSFASLAHHTHSQRPSMSYSQSGRTYGHPLEQIGRDEMQAKFANMNLGDGPGASTSSLPGPSPYGNGSSQTQFNPMSQPWGQPTQTYPGEYQKDVFSAISGYEKRGSIPDRPSPAGSAYRAALSSPKSYTGTPQPPSDTWSRPASRDHRTGPELERRALPLYPSPYYPNPYLNGYQQAYPGMYDHYSFRPPLPMGPAYGVPVHQYITGANGVPPIRPAKDQDPARGMRSQLLDDFRSTSKSNKRYELKHIYGHIVEFSGDQHGSRFIQEKLESANSDEKDQVFKEIEPNALQLMRDVFGNYVIQKFFEHGNQVQKKILAGVMKGKVIDLSLQMYACRVVQKALEHVLVEQQAELVKELEGDILKVVKDQNGNHVVQKIIELVPRQHLDFIMTCLKGRVNELSSHTYGCRVIQRVLEHGSDSDKTVIMGELHQCAQVLITDQYGNYVTQHVIVHGKPEDSAKIIEIVTKDLLFFSKHKFASNVVEKCIERGTPQELSRIREGLSVPGDDLNSPMLLMIKDQYGNYVIQKLLNQLSGAEREAYIEVIRPHVAALKKANTSQRQVLAIERLINQPTPPPSATPESPAVDGVSVAPTPPGLTMAHNSPSSSPPSTHDGALCDVAATADENGGAKLFDADGTPCTRSDVAS